MRIGLIRHGETDWNAAARLQGTTDIPLNERGIEQAKDASHLLVGHSWSRVVTSPLERTRHTAQIIANRLQLPEPEVVPDIIERSFGELEGSSVYRDDGTRLPLNHPSVEGKDVVQRRVLAALQQLANDYPDDDILAITHGSVVRLTLDALLSWKAPHISNLALSILESSAERELGFHVRSANGYPLVHN